MKKSLSILSGLLVLLFMQRSYDSTAQSLLTRDTIRVSDRETTYLLFPEAVDLVDIGRTGAYAARIEGQSVFLKALNAQAGLTNMLIRYGGDNYFTAKLLFAVKPHQTLYDLRETPEPPVEQDKERDNEADLSLIQARLEGLKEKKGRKFTAARSQHHMKARITHLVNDREATYLGIAVANHSSIDYQLDFVGFSLVEKKGKRFSRNNRSQKELLPIASDGPGVIRAREAGQLFYALPLYAMTSRGKLEILIREQKGSRILRLTVPARKINQAPLVEYE